MKWSLPLLTSILAACGSAPENFGVDEEPLTPQKVLLPFTSDQSSNWHKGNWHGTQNNPFPPFCPLGGPSARAYYCIYDMQAYGDNDVDDTDHLWLAGGEPPWGNDELAAGLGWSAFGVAELSTQISSAQFNGITAIDYVEIRMTASVTPVPYGASESLIPLMADGGGFPEVGDPKYVTQDGTGHEVVWQLTTNPGVSPTQPPWTKYTLPIGWGFANGNAIGSSRHGAIFVHSMQVYVAYR